MLHMLPGMPEIIGIRCIFHNICSKLVREGDIERMKLRFHFGHRFKSFVREREKEREKE